jgi:hypothetical protein
MTRQLTTGSLSSENAVQPTDKTRGAWSHIVASCRWVTLGLLTLGVIGSCSKKQSNSPTDPGPGGKTFAWTIRYEPHVWSPVVLVSNGSSLLAIGEDSIFRSTDGTHWSTAGAGIWGVSDVVWSGTKFIAVGGTNAYVSGDGSSWSTVNTPNVHVLNAVSWGFNVAVAVGDSGTVLTSGDGATWVSHAAPTARHLRDVIWAGQAFWVVGDSGVLLTSPNGLSWNIVNAGLTANLGRIFWSGSLYLASGQDTHGGRSIISRSVDGVVWTTSHISTTYDSDCYQYSIAWSGTTYIAVGGGYCNAGNRTTVLTSPDGATWTDRVAPANIQGLRSIAWFGSRFVALCRGGTIVTSPDASAWTIALPGGECGLNAAAYSGTRYVAVGPVFATSSDGVTWIPQLWNRNNTLLSTIAWSGTVFAAGGANGRIYTSADGITWQDRSLVDTTVYIEKLLWANNQFVGVGERRTNGSLKDAVSIVSSDGASWALHPTGFTNTWFSSVAWQSDQYIAVGIRFTSASSVGTIAKSADGINWSIVSSGFGNWVRDIASGGGQYVTCGSFTGVFVSSDGQTWNSLPILNSDSIYPRLYKVVYNGTEFHAFGEGVFASATGASWEEVRSLDFHLTASGVGDIVWTGDRFLLVNGLIGSSTESN